MRIGIASDHAGFHLKEFLKNYLENQGHSLIDFGADDAEHSCSYARSAFFLGQALQEGKIERGIAICGTGLGISMAANKMEGIRAALCFNEYMAKMARNHNDANVLALGARVIAEGLASSIVDVFFREEFEGGRHLARIQSIDEIGKGEFKL